MERVEGKGRASRKGLIRTCTAVWGMALCAVVARNLLVTSVSISSKGVMSSRFSGLVLL